MAKHELDPIQAGDFSEPGDTYKPSGELHKFTGATSLDAHFTSHGLTAEQTESALDKLIASAPNKVMAPAGPADFWRSLVVNPGPLHRAPLAEVMNLTATVGIPVPAFEDRSESKQIEDLAWQLVARARRANLVLTIETARHPDNDKVMGNYSLAVELRPSLASIREKAERRAIHDAEFERNELGLEPQT